MQTRSRVSSLVGKHICTENYITDQTRLVPPHEYNSELNYTLARLPGVYVMPNVQYVRNPVASSPTKAR